MSQAGDTLYEVQKKYLENSANKIPMLFMADVINGFQTVFPVPLAQGCSFNPELVKRVCPGVCQGSAAAGLHVTFSPMADFVPRCEVGTRHGIYGRGCVAGTVR